jgi:hypothetical protein
MSDLTAAPARDAWRLFWWVLAATLLANAAMLAIDHEPLFIIGDSMVYVNSAFGTGGPSDRSFAYGRYFIRPLLWLFGSLDAVVVAQAVMASCCAGILAVILRLGFGVGGPLAFVVAVAYVAEPLALLYQHMMMTEGPALFFLAFFLLLGILYLRQPRYRLLAGLAAASVGGVAFRVSMLPVLMASMVLLPPLAFLRGWPVPRPLVNRAAWHLAVGLALTFGMHALYKNLYHSVTGQPAGYNSADGFFLLASWAPLLTRADVPDPALFDRIVPTLGANLADRFARPGQRFSPNGLIQRLIEAEQNNGQAANALAKKIALNIGRRDPVGVLELGWRTYLDFWNPPVMAHVLSVDEGQQEADPPLIALFHERYNEDISRHQLLRTFVKSWHAQGASWYRVVLLTPLIWLAALILRPRRWRPMLLVGLSVIGLMLVDTLLVVEPVVRYLHSIAWLTILLFGVIVQALWDIIAGAGGRTWRRMTQRAGAMTRPVPADTR